MALSLNSPSLWPLGLGICKGYLAVVGVAQRLPRQLDQMPVLI